MRRALLIALMLVPITGAGGALAQPAGEAVIAWHVTLAPSWFDPSTAPPQITAFGVL
jgi:peptide/nickel transport system substrate-binding protein